MDVKGWLAGALVLSEMFSPGLEARTAPEPETVPFLSARAGEIVVPVFIGGQGPYRFLLDTGSSHTLISAALADRLAALPVAKAPVATSTGTVTYLVVRVPDVRLGSAHADDLLATALPPEAAALFGKTAAGVIGQDFLARFNFSLDYRHGRLVWNDGDAASRVATRLALRPSGGRFLVELPQEDRCGCPIHMVPDSGADGFVLFNRGGVRKLSLQPGRAESFHVDSLAGGAAAQAVTLMGLRVGGATVHHEPAALLEAPGDPSEEGDGLLPLHLFNRVYFNNRDSYMALE